LDLELHFISTSEQARSEHQRAVEAAMEIYVMRNGEQLGLFSPEDAQAQIDNGVFSAADSAWAAVLDEWKPLRDVLLSTGSGAPENKSSQKQKRIGRIRGTVEAEYAK